MFLHRLVHSSSHRGLPRRFPLYLWARRRKAALRAFSFIFLFSASLIVGDGLHDRLGRADVALVLGNKVNPNGQPSRGLQARLDRTLDIFHRGLVSAIIVSGGTGREGFDEARVMASYLEQHGVPAGKIIEDPQGVNTYASALNTVRIMRAHGFGSVLVVSQYFHLSRAKLALRKVGLSRIYAAHAYLFSWRDLYSIVREVLGYGAYSLRHYESRNPSFARVACSSTVCA